MKLLLPFLFCIALLRWPNPASAATVRIRLAPEGDILGWIVLGPLPNPGTPHESCGGWDRDYLASAGGEPAAALSEATRVAASADDLRQGRVALASVRGGLDIAAAVRSDKQGVAYAYAALESSTQMDARLLVGSDDGVKVWLNGELIHSKHLRRGLTRDEDTVAMRLRQGSNRLLLKVDQGEGGWALMARLVADSGKAPEGVVSALDIAAEMRDREDPLTAMVRKAAGKSGSVDVEMARDWLEWSQTASRWVRAFQKDATAPERLEAVISESAGRVSSAEALDANALSKALGESAAAVRKQYEASRTAFLYAFQTPAPLVDASPLEEDYIRVAMGGRYFARADGKPFIPIGYNHNPDWDRLIESNPLHPSYDPAVTEQFFKRLSQCGVNVVRLMLETPASGLLENPIGTFVPEHVRWIDNVVLAARKANVRLLITPWDTFWMNLRWDIVPYNSANGGPVARRSDFLARPDVQAAQKRRLEYVVDRWGNTGTIFAWDVLNEADLWWETTPEQVRAWAKEMMRHIRDYERRKWGRAHLVTTSIAAPTPGGVLGDLAYRALESDFANTHLYIGAARAPSEPVGPAVAEHQGVAYALEQIEDRRPYLDSESGPIDRWISDAKLDDEVHHNTSWAHLASGGAGSGLRWPYRGPHYLSDGMFENLRLMSEFVKKVPWEEMPWAKGQMPSIAAPEGWAAMICGSSRAAILWVLSKSGEGGDATVSIAWPGTARNLKCRPYDTHTGKWLDTLDAALSGGKAVVTLKGLPKSTAFVIEPR